MKKGFIHYIQERKFDWKEVTQSTHSGTCLGLNQESLACRYHALPVELFDFFKDLFKGLILFVIDQSAAQLWHLVGRG